MLNKLNQYFFIRTPFIPDFLTNPHFSYPYPTPILPILANKIGFPTLICCISVAIYYCKDFTIATVGLMQNKRRRKCKAEIGRQPINAP